MRELAFALAASLLSSLALCRLLIVAGLFDAPTLARKMHKAPTPTSGGLGIGFGFALGLISLSLPAATEWNAGLAPGDMLRIAFAAAAAFAFMVIGFIDDATPLGPRGKLAAFALVSLAGPCGAGVVEVLALGAGREIEIGFTLGLIGSALWVFTMANCVNFMDGANGLAMGAAAIGLGGLALASFPAGAPDAGVLALCGAGALAGFLVWNFPGGRLFAGDSGALFAGALAGLASLMAVRAGVSPFVPPLLFFPMLADALLTLLWRAGRKRNLLDGHNEHIYQLGLRAGMSHRKVTLFYWVASLHCALVAVVASEVQRGASAVFAAGADHIAIRAATLTPLIAFGVCALVAARIGNAAHRFAHARGLDA